jgi:hypothetical protein
MSSARWNRIDGGPGDYRFSDYPRRGIPLDLPVITDGTVPIHIFWPL